MEMNTDEPLSSTQCRVREVRFLDEPQRDTTKTYVVDTVVSVASILGEGGRTSVADVTVVDRGCVGVIDVDDSCVDVVVVDMRAGGSSAMWSDKR
ncbi:hypothetical protein YC2023_065748 [Brassica napus]